MLKQFLKLNYSFIRKQETQYLKFRNCLLIKQQQQIHSASVKTDSKSISDSKIDFSLNKDRQTVVVTELGQQELEYPFVWLRDNCQCSKCFHKGTFSRTIDWEKFDINSYPTNIEFAHAYNAKSHAFYIKKYAQTVPEKTFNDDNSNLKITWNDQHESNYDLNWLKHRNFNSHNREKYLRDYYRPDKHLWGRKDFSKILKSFDFHKVLETDAELRKWLEALAIYGIAMIKNTPAAVTETRKIANRVGFIKRTHYGEEFVITSKERTSNVAYLSQNLQMHTDLPYYEYKPGTNLLHCLVQSTSQGGHNTIADGFYVAEYMKNHYPIYYDALVSTLVNWSDIGEENGSSFHSIFRAPVICVGRDGKLDRINHSVPQRDSFFTVPIEELQIWYPAMKKFVQLIHKESVRFKTEPGDILTFDNIRLIHGRTEYSDTSSNSRHLIGSYLDWDEIYSRLRVLKSAAS